MAPSPIRFAETRRLLALAGPVVLTGLNWTLLQVTDVVVVGAVSTREAAALGASRSLTFVGIVTGLAWLSGVLVFAARADGAGDAARLRGVLRDGVALALVLGMALAALLFVAAAPLLAAIGVAGELVAPGAHVVRVIALGYPFQLLLIAAGFFLEGISRPGRRRRPRCRQCSARARCWSRPGTANLPALGPKAASSQGWGGWRGSG